MAKWTHTNSTKIEGQLSIELLQAHTLCNRESPSQAMGVGRHRQILTDPCLSPATSSSRGDRRKRMRPSCQFRRWAWAWAATARS